MQGISSELWFNWSIYNIKLFVFMKVISFIYTILLFFSGISVYAWKWCKCASFFFFFVLACKLYFSVNIDPDRKLENNQHCRLYLFSDAFCLSFKNKLSWLTSIELEIASIEGLREGKETVPWVHRDELVLGQMTESASSKMTSWVRDARHQARGGVFGEMTLLHR